MLVPFFASLLRCNSLHMHTDRRTQDYGEISTPVWETSSTGHPIGATGCILTVKALYELRRIGGKYALVSMCIGGGQGIAAIFEAM